MGFVTYALEESGVAGRVGFYDPVVDGVCWFVTYADAEKHSGERARAFCA